MVPTLEEVRRKLLATTRFFREEMRRLGEEITTTRAADLNEIEQIIRNQPSKQLIADELEAKIKRMGTGMRFLGILLMDYGRIRLSRMIMTVLEEFYETHEIDRLRAQVAALEEDARIREAEHARALKAIEDDHSSQIRSLREDMELLKEELGQTKLTVALQRGSYSLTPGPETKAAEGTMELLGEAQQLIKTLSFEVQRLSEENEALKGVATPPPTRHRPPEPLPPPPARAAEPARFSRIAE